MLNFAAYCNGIYGVTRDPHDNEYAIVMKFQNLGNMREFIKNKHNLNWELIIKILHNVSYGLSTIHRENYHHRDFHSGNILLEGYGKYISPVISDFGLCRPAGQVSADKTLYGVLPFVAPEVLRGEEFTEKSDVYGQLSIKLKIEEEFSQEKENRWKARLSNLTTNPHPSKMSQNRFTSKLLDFSTRLISATCKIRRSECLSTRITTGIVNPL
ncbi:unnamed protein product [Rhizophagus irregularis]|nr:unnamed protein product [Rhizophagus irregularis]